MQTREHVVQHDSEPEENPDNLPDNISYDSTELEPMITGDQAEETNETAAEPAANKQKKIQVRIYM